MRRINIVALLFGLLLMHACEKHNPSQKQDEPSEPSKVSAALDLSITMPGVPVEGSSRTIDLVWPDNPEIRLKPTTGTKAILPGSVSSDGRTATFSGSMEVEEGAVALKGAFPAAEPLSVPALQYPAEDCFDTSVECLSLSATLVADKNSSRIEKLKAARPLAYICLSLGSSFAPYADEALRYVVLSSGSSVLSGDFSLFLGEAFPEGSRAGDRQLVLNYTGKGRTLGGASFWAVSFAGNLDISTIKIVTDRRKIVLAGRTVEAEAGIGRVVSLELGSGDSVEDFHPAPADDGGQVYYCADGTIAGPAYAENFYCPVNGHSYSPYTLRFLDPFTLRSSNPNGWSTSSANKLSSSQPLLTAEQYASVWPYLMFYTATNTIYGPASRYSAMQFYSFDAMLYVNQLGTPAVQFRRMSASGDETTVAGWVKQGIITSISTASDGIVTVKSSSGTVSRNFKVDKTAMFYDASSTDRDCWKEGDVIMLQHLGRYGKVDSPEYLGSGFLYVKKIHSDGYEKSSGAFKTMDHHASISVASYWERKN